MTEKEKLQKGLLYNPNKDDILISETKKAKELCYEFNNMNPSNIIERKNIIEQLFGKIGENFVINPNFYCDYGYNIEIGNNFYANHNLTILDVSRVVIGDNVLIGPNTGIYTAGHPIDHTDREKGLEFGKPITIGSNVWIGGNVVILPGVTVGDNSVIGAGSVVTKDIPSNVVAIGNPCKVHKQL